MKKVRINIGKIGIVKVKGDYKRIITAGSHWLKFNETVWIVDQTAIYSADIDFKIMMQDENFSSRVNGVEVGDGEIALQYEGANFKQVLNSGKYYHWKGLSDYTFILCDLNKVEIDANIKQSVLLSPSIINYVRVYTVASYEEGLLFVDGKFVKKLLKGSYYFWKNSINIEVLKADMRQLQLEVSGQEMLTKDKAALRLNFYAQYRVADSEKALLDSKDFEKQLYILMQLALREYVGTQTLDELLDSKEGINNYVSQFVKAKSSKLGIELLDSGLRDIILPGEVKEIMNQVLIAQKQAQANTISRREETASTRSLLNTAKLMEDNEMLFKLKEMEYIEKIADRIGDITVSGGNQVVDQLKQIFSK